jgi:hypothetical protein
MIDTLLLLISLASNVAVNISSSRLEKFTAKNWQKLRDYLNLHSPAANHDLQKALYRSYFQVAAM